MWWNFLNNLNELIIWIIAIVFFGVTSIIGIIIIIKWIIRLF